MDTAKSVANEIISKTEELNGEISKATAAINEAYEDATTPDSENYIVPKVECTKEVWNLFIQENPDFATYGKYTWRDGYIIRKNNVD